MKKNGFTLIELILYIAIFSIIMIGLVQVSWTVIGAGSKSSVQEEVFSQARYLSEKLKYEIRNANGINIGTSNFDTNLASSSALQLSLIQDAPDNPTIINVSSGKAQIKKGSAAAVSLNSNDTVVQDLTFSNYSSGDSKTLNISFTFTIAATSGSGRWEFSESAVMRSDAEIRSN